MKSIAINVFLFGLLLFSASPAPAQSEIRTEAPNWCGFATQYLRKRNGDPFDCGAAGRCIKMNNYGCSQNHTATPYPGQLTTPQGSPVRDSERHVVYEHPKWSVQRTIRTLQRYYAAGKQTPLAIAETYAPWCDTRGSKMTKGGWGRTCVDRLPSVPSAFAGPRCAKPRTAPSRAQCENCNCPSTMANFYRQGVTDSVDDRLELFDASNRPTAMLARLLPRVFIFETGYVPTDALIAEAIASYQP